MAGKGYVNSEHAKQMRRQRIDENPPLCNWCGRIIRPPRRYHQAVRYCTPQHAELAKRERMRERSRIRNLSVVGIDDTDNTPESGLYPDSKVRRGAVLESIRAYLNEVDWEMWVDQGIPNTQVAEAVGASVNAVGMARRAAHNERVLAVKAQGFSMKPHHAEMLGPSDTEMADLLAKDPVKFQERLRQLTDAFVAWRTEFFTVGFERPYITKNVHKRWIERTLYTIYTGGRLLILSPPRHGKTDLLIHFCVWLICRNPDIRILWVGPNGDIAENCLGQVRNLLETHEELREAYLPSDQTWAPTSRRKATSTWQRTKFTVANRTLTLKQPTMWCTGVGGTILSIDADFIIVDDPADPDASYTPGGRDKIANWFKVKLITRKMFHTGLAMISSRVHPDDLYSEFVDSANWSVVVDKAHDQSICRLDLFDTHPDPKSCILFPEINPLAYLREQADVVGQSLFEMMYLNQPRPDHSMIFDVDKIRTKCLDPSRDIGLSQIPGSYRLVAGLDPAARGVQAAFLWAVRLKGDQANPRDPYNRGRPLQAAQYHMVDLETQQAGGIEGAEKVMRSWHEKYGVTLWVIEDNSYQKVFFDDPRIKLVKAELGLDIRPTHTGKNKHDPDFGVAAMAPLFHEGHVILPYATREAQRLTDNYIRQLGNFTGETGSSKKLSDILMASWFPHATVIKKWKRDERNERVQPAHPVSYPGYGQLQPAATVAWVDTTYPYN